jgi:hypothetical protein
VQGIAALLEATAPEPELTNGSGRVYRMSPSQCRVAIDWAPPSPILGCTVLTRGLAEVHPSEGKVVRFPRAIRRRRGTATIAVRANNRPDLLELFDLATALEAKLISESESKFDIDVPNS